MFVEKLNKSQVQSILDYVYGCTVNLVENDRGWKFNLDDGLIVCIVSVYKEGTCSIALRDSSISLANGATRYDLSVQREMDNNEYKNQMYKVFGNKYATYLKKLNAEREY